MRCTCLVLCMVALASETRATDIPIAGRKLIVLDKLASAGKAKAVFLTTRDAVVTKGSATDPLQIEASLDVVYGSARGAFVMPQGANWLVNSSTVAKYANKDAPIGGAVKVNVIQNGQLVKVVAKNLGDTPIDVSQPQNGVVSVAYTVTNGAETTRLCTHFVGCEHKPVAGGTGSKVVCVGNLQIPTTIGDGACVAAAGPPAAVTMVAPAAAHTCALFDIGAVRCWGSGYFGVLGYGNTNTIGDDEPPTAAGFVPVGRKVTQIAAGGSRTCALLEGGTVRCWGSGDRPLGYGNSSTIGDDEPAGAVGDVQVGVAATQLAVGRDHICALTETGSVRCWGGYPPLPTLGELGYGNTAVIGDDESPSFAGDVDVGGTVVQIAAGALHTCALLDTGAVRCWGYGAAGALGYGNTNSIGDDETPASAGDVNVGGTVVQIATGERHTCALLDTGAVRCWGEAFDGTLGYGNTIDIGDDEAPASAGDVNVGGTVVQIAAGALHTCALLDTGAVRCWGNGADGRLGYGNTNSIGDNETPASAGDVDVGGTVVQIAAGGGSTCALLATGAVRCWGDGLGGQLGYGNSNDIGDNETPASAGDVPLF